MCFFMSLNEGSLVIGEIEIDPLNLFNHWSHTCNDSFNYDFFSIYSYTYRFEWFRFIFFLIWTDHNWLRFS